MISFFFFFLRHPSCLILVPDPRVWSSCLKSASLSFLLWYPRKNISTNSLRCPFDFFDLRHSSLLTPNCTFGQTVRFQCMQANSVNTKCSSSTTTNLDYVLNMIIYQLELEILCSPCQGVLTRDARYLFRAHIVSYTYSTTRVRHTDNLLTRTGCVGY